jgi:hypothetical protein
MIKQYFLFLVAILCVFFSQAQSFRWVKKAGSTQPDFARNITLDNSDNIYIAGKFGGTQSFDSAGFTRSLVSAGGSDIYVAKMNCARNLVWANRIGGTGSEPGIYGAIDIRYDRIGNVYVTGAFEGTATFTTTSGVSQTLSSTGGSDAFFAKYDTSGVLQWALKAGSSGRDEGFGVNIDWSGNIVFTGMYGGSITFQTTSGSTLSMPHTGALDGYMAKYSPAGVLMWTTRNHSVGDDLIALPRFDRQNNIYVASNFGCCSGFTTTFGSVSISDGGGWGAYVAKADSNGNWIWVNGTGSAADEAGSSCAVDDSGNVFVVGHFSGSGASLSSAAPGLPIAMSSAGSYDVYIARYSTTGVLQWANVVGGTGQEVTYCATLNERNNVVLTGSFNGTANFMGTFLTSAGSSDIFVSEFTKSGSLVSAIRAGGPGADDGFSVASDSKGALYISGAFSNTATFGSSSVSSSGNVDSYVAKISPGLSFDLVSPSVPLCAPDSALIAPASALPENSTFTWLRNGTIMIGEGNDTLMAKTTGIYQLIATNGCNESDTSQPVAVNITSILASAGNDTTIMLGDSARLMASGGTSYLWSPATGLSNSGIANPKASPSATTQYIVTVTSGGCSATDTVIVTVGSPQPCFNCITPTTPLNNSLVACYPFNGNANDASGNNYHGTVIGATLGTDRFGNANSAYYLNGTSNYISVAPNYPDATKFSVSTWIKPSGNAASDGVILWDGNSLCGNDVVLVYKNNTISVRADKNGATLNTWSPPTPDQVVVSPSLFNQWYHVVWVMDSAQSYIYVNGTLVKTINVKGSGVGDHYTPTFGAFNDGNTAPCGSPMTNFFDGGLDDIRIYNRSLSSMEVSILYNNIPPLVAGAGNDTTIYTGDSSQLYASGGTGYLWSPATGLSNAGISNPKASPATTTTYIVKITNGSCFVYDTVVVSLVPRPCNNCIATNPVNTGLVACYPLDVNANNAVGPAFNGTNVGAVSAIDRFGKLLSAYGFNGTTQYIRLGDILDSVFTKPVAKFSVSGWAKSNTWAPWAGGGIMIGKSGGGSGTAYQWSINHDNDGKVGGYVASDAAGLNFIEAKSTVIPVGQWFHYVMIFDGSLPETQRLKLYVNTVAGAISRDIGTLGTATANTNQEVTIGAGHNYNAPATPSNQYSGTLDNIKIFNRALSLADVTALYIEKNSFAVTGNDTTILAGDTAQLISSGGTSYSWSPSAGLSNANISNPKASPVSTTSYVVTVTNGSCTAKDTVVVTVITSLCNACTGLVPSGLLGCYRLNNNTLDGSGLNNNGTGTNVTYGADRFSKPQMSGTFNGTSSSVSIPSSAFVGLNTYTYSLWVKLSTLPPSGNLYSLLSIGSVAADQFISISTNPVSGTNGIGYSSYFSTGIPDRYADGISPTVGVWYHVALTRTTTTLKFYINGALMDTRATSNANANYGSSGLAAAIGSRLGTLQYTTGHWIM